MNVRIAAAAALLGLPFVACSGTSPEEEGVGASDQSLVRAETTGTYATAPTSDAGGKDASVYGGYPIKSGGVTETAPPPSGPSACAPVRYDIVLKGRACWELARRTSHGLWTVAPLYPDAPAAIRDTRCAVTFIPDAPACEDEDPASALGLSCGEMHATSRRSAECAANPAQCASSASFDGLNKPSEQLPEPACEVPDTGVDTKPGNSVGGCDSCGVVYGGILYVTNPYDDTTLNVGLTTAGTPTPTVLNVAPYSSFAMPVGSTYATGPVSVWR